MKKEAVKVSVVICTYNPIDDIFRKCLETVRSASSVYAPHEILIIDNNSTVEISSRDYVKVFLEEHKNTRVLHESKQGLTPARLRGIRESSGDLIIFVDDDNFIEANFFDTAVDIFLSYPYIGAYSGQVSLEYDKQPEKWTKKYWGMLIYRPLDKDVWSNIPFNTNTMPNGAGLCIARDVGEYYLGLFQNGKRNFNLDRSKESLMSGGDNDLAMCACDIGKGMGLFKDLRLRHHIAANRFTLEYLSRLAYGIYFSYAMLLFMRTGKIDRQTFKQKMKHLLRISIMKRNDRIIQRSCKKGLTDAVKLIRSASPTTR
jgi:glycosyltransferase involved in cell wall biosynthesis